jgi:hypothetical protein
LETQGLWGGDHLAKEDDALFVLEVMQARRIAIKEGFVTARQMLQGLEIGKNPHFAKEIIESRRRR